MSEPQQNERDATNAPNTMPDTGTIDMGEMQRFRAIVERIAAEIPPFLTAKHMAYGKGNVNKNGQYGIAVRLDDKTERIKNMVTTGQATAVGEALEDTWLDIIGYGVLGLMLARGEEV